MRNNMPNQSKYSVKLNLLDRLVAHVNPKAGLDRVRARATFQAMENSGFITPNSGKRFTRDWNPSELTADQDVLPKLGSARAGSRDLYMNNPVATAILRRSKTNVAAWGLEFQSRVDRILLSRALGWKDEKFDEVEYNIEQEVYLWAHSPDCDASRHFWFPDLQGLALFNTMLSGDVFAALPYIPRKGCPYDLRVQVVEGDMICNPNLRMDDDKIAGGIELDEYGAEKACHVWKPNNRLMYGMSGPSVGDTWKRVDMFDPSTGRPQMLHLFDKERPGQRRGMPFLAPLFQELKQLARLSKAELDAAVINSFFTVFVKSSLPVGNDLAAGFIPGITGVGADPTAITDEDSNPADEKVYELGSGNVISLDTDEDVTLADPKRPNQNFEQFFHAIVRQLGAACEIPFEVLMLHFTSSYSASRGAILEAWKFFRTRRVWLIRYFNTPIVSELITDAVLMGRLDLPGFFDDPRYRMAWLGSKWTGIGQGQLDPKSETDAYCKQIDYVLTAREDVHAKLNEDGSGDWSGTVNRAGREKKALESKGLMTNPALEIKDKPGPEPQDDDSTDKENKEERDEE